MSKVNEKKIVYIDMDGVLVDFKSAFIHIRPDVLKEYEGREDDIEGIFCLMEPMINAIFAFKVLSNYFDVYILSTAPWVNDSAPSDKKRWVKEHLGELAHKKLILTHHKHLNIGDYLIDDRLKNGAEKFTGEHIHFGSDKFPDWKSVITYLIPKND